MCVCVVRGSDKCLAFVLLHVLFSVCVFQYCVFTLMHVHVCVRAFVCVSVCDGMSHITACMYTIHVCLVCVCVCVCVYLSVCTLWLFI